jgi:uncharacterized protein (TIGR03663 family)
MTGKSWIAILCVAGVALALRLPRLSLRPMHGDEAVHAYKFGELIEHNAYQYDPHEFHGPTLNYFTLIPALLRGQTTYGNLDAFTLRIVTAAFGMALVLMPLLLVPGIPRSAAAVAAILTAISPAFVFYSRYYIQEMLLICFTFGLIAAAYRYLRSPRPAWAIAAGACAGLMYATKETCVIAFASMIVAVGAVLLLRRVKTGHSPTAAPRVKLLHTLIALIIAVVIAELFFTSFGFNPHGVVDSVTTYTTYLDRAGQNQIHNHPWYYYLKLLFYSDASMGGAPWTEGIVVILAAVGTILIITKVVALDADVSLLWFLLFYTVIVTAAYSFTPYKTPWCLLTFYHGMILLGAVGAAAVFRSVVRPSAKFILAFAFLMMTLDLSLQTVLANFVFYADHSNPYVYGHPTTDVFRIQERVEQIASVHPQGDNLAVEVICTDGDYWPLPWYLRRFPNVGWRNSVGELPRTAPVVLTLSELQDEVISKLYALALPGQKNLYVFLFDEELELRPTIEIQGYVTKDLFDRYGRMHPMQAAEVQ